ncbi:amino acid ABC transporter ATP-binding protein [Limosilactobacillus coleohominis]|jgi:polar amino acid transport system ATP-binding protein|uniref:Amino acid ABC transporter ATP-binding protein n=1 Tax=Limosilactobacillus coleohominis TaxID=181675 RepID=A0ABS2H2T6_9LACO|nr:amino acid ABC transporter ATP-binding protein [Limosilactobacillus coleohominis]MBM6941349.1 amino acid ABC transporter ATP-binding protein [Limosilactobacillus coleohominis]MBM6954415.1 amino acid ABC transporter ATP-binding protein [Limosilactobacillus coleohominis]HJA23960.1 amino acid ABC transporter ATP-binding protein [Candidatus Limosilactobacillus intestinavium]
MLEVKNLKKSFDGRPILDDISFNVKDGEILTIVGPSGAGKTTLLRCITGLESADSGDFLIDGQQFNPQDLESSEAVMGVVFQDFNLFPHLSVLENLTLAPTMVLKQDPKIAEERALDLLAQLGLKNKEHLYPYQLSGGQKQRVAIARALAMKPKILCYDEPTSALDPNLRDEVAKLILSLKEQGVTQLVVTHDMEFAKKIADNMLTVKALDQRN